MGDQFRVEPEQVRSLYGAVAGQQEVPTRCANGLEECRSADTGDAALSGELQQVVGQFIQALTALSEALAHDAQRLNETAQRYDQADQSVAADFGHVRAALPSGAPVLAGRPATSLRMAPRPSEAG